MISPAHNFIRVTKSIKMRWAEHAARMGDRRGAYRVLVGRPNIILILFLILLFRLG